MNAPAAKVTPPHPSPRRPRLTLPRGACDCHVHVYGPAARFPYAPERPYTPDDAPVERLLGLYDVLGISRAVYVQATVHGYDNSAILDAMARHPARSRGVALVRNDVGDGELRALHAAGIRGVRFNFVRHLGRAPDTDAVLRMAERISPLGWHVQLHLDARDIIEQGRFFEQMPTPFAIDHMGRTPAAAGVHQEACVALLALLSSNPRAWIKLSGPERISAHMAGGGTFPYDDAVPFARQLLEAAPDRAVWGTDWPHPNVREMPDDGDLVDFIGRYTDEQERQRLLVDNPTRLYDFDLSAL